MKSTIAAMKALGIELTANAPHYAKPTTTKSGSDVMLTELDRTRRAVLVCQAFARNLAFYRAGKEPEVAQLLNEKHPDADYWRESNNNFLDMAVLAWCILLGDKKGEHSWAKVLTDPQKFEADLQQHLGLKPDEYQSVVDEIRTYRDKFIAHLDQAPTMHIPKMDVYLNAVKFYHKALCLNACPGDLRGLAANAEGFSKGYDQCFQDARELLKKAAL